MTSVEKDTMTSPGTDAMTPLKKDFMKKETVIQVNDRTSTCGLWSFRPAWLQRLATKQVYVLLYVLLGAVQGMGHTYMSSVLSTIEKQFGITSKEAAWVFSGNEVSQICFIFFLPFLSKIRKRSLWTSIALMVSSVGLLFCAAPFFGRDKSQYEGGWHTQATVLSDTCGEQGDAEEQCKVKNVREVGGLALIFIGYFISGIGNSFFHSFGIPYIDDNISKKNSPVVLSLVLAGRVMGPAFGFVLGSFCLNVYVAPGLEGPGGLKEGDSGWLGAWWLGFVVIAAITSVLAPFLALFPERLPTMELTDAKKAEKKAEETLKEPVTGREYVQETIECTKRLLKNKVYVFNCLSTIFFLFGFVGFGTFIPKYFEYHFKRSASSSGGSGGLSKAGGSVLGIVIGGLVIQKFRFTARTLSGWNVVVGFITMINFIGLSFMACPKLEIQWPEVDGLISPPCRLDCHCSSSTFQPTCSLDGSTLFFSPCQAGCKSSSTVTWMEDGLKNEQKLYSDCSCVAEASVVLNTSLANPWWGSNQLPSPTIIDTSVTGAAAGFCPFDCDRVFFTMLGLFVAMAILGATGRVGNQLVGLRAVEPRDKAASLVVMVSALSLLVFLPSPIIFGAIMDQTCVVWGQNCGEQTNCQLYDTDRMRAALHYTVAVFVFLATLADVGVWWYSKEVKLFDEEEIEEGKEMNTVIVGKK